METQVRTTVQFKVNFSGEETDAIRRCFDGDHVEAPFRDTFAMETSDDLRKFADAIVLAVEWGQADKDDVEILSQVRRNLRELAREVQSKESE